MNPELLLVETDHDMRNPANMLVLDRIARFVFHIPGVARVQTITRPLGTPIEHTSIPFQISMQNTTNVENSQYMKKRMADMLKQAESMQDTIDTMNRMYAIMGKLAALTHHMDGLAHEMLDTTATLRDNIANFDDFFHPLRAYFYWEKHCFDIPVCWALRSTSTHSTVWIRSSKSSPGLRPPWPSRRMLCCTKYFRHAIPPARGKVSNIGVRPGWALQIRFTSRHRSLLLGAIRRSGRYTWRSAVD